MTRILIAAIVSVAFGGGTVLAQTIKTEPMKRVPASDGAGMYNAYCASCHGLDATGNGPAAKALAKAPADLTKISARNGGKFPDIKVKRYIEGADEVAAHGSRDMPVWGTLFRTMEPGSMPMRVNALSEFLKSVQK